MKITRIQIDGILGISSIDVKPQTAIQLFAGSNGSGKSSIRDSIALAIAQQTARDVSMKKEYDALVRDGAQQGGALITMNNDIDQTFAFNMPDGKFAGMEISDSMRVALDGQRFASMTPDLRRTFLFDLTKCKPNGERVKARMLQKGCDPAKTEAVLPLLRTGFPSVCEHAKSKATEAKGAWRALTGETYGAVKAQSWVAPLPTLPDGDIKAMSAQVEACDKSIATMNESLGAIKLATHTARDNAAKRASLEESAKKVPDLVDQLARAQAELAEYEPKVVALRARAGGVAKVGLVHEMAKFIDSEDFSGDENSQREADVLLSRYESEHGKLGAKVDTDAQAALPDHEKGLGVMQNRVKNLQRDLDVARQCKGQFDALAPVDDAVGASEDEIAEITQLIVTAKAERQSVQNKLLDIEAAIKNSNAAANKTQDAAKHHADVLAWTVVADALAPDGIPSELLADSLKPVNDTLEQAALDTEWMQVKIGPDMDITAGGRPYRLLSESEQWRVDAMIAQTVSEISGLKILMLDRMDVLDLTGRAQLLDWLDVLAENDLLDTALLFATLKAPPSGLAEHIQAYWVENGAISGAEKRGQRD